MLLQSKIISIGLQTLLANSQYAMRYSKAELRHGLLVIIRYLDYSVCDKMNYVLVLSVRNPTGGLRRSKGKKIGRETTVMHNILIFFLYVFLFFFNNNYNLNFGENVF